MNQPLTVTVSAELVAWYGAIVATLAVILSGWVAWRDRARIVVHARAGLLVTPGGPYDASKEYIAITVANRGRRPRTISTVGLKVHVPKQVLLAGDCAVHGPQELAEGRSFQWFVEQDTVNLQNVEYVWALDQLGREFRGKLRA